MSKIIKVPLPAHVAHRLYQESQRHGCPMNAIGLKAIERYLGTLSSVTPDPEIAVERIEFDNGYTATTVALTKQIASTVERLAREQERSRSWIVRSLLRDALRARGLWTKTETAAVPTPAEAPQAAA
jgi:hypothetical protein